MKNLFNVVLFAPEIPQNSGNIGRLCVSTQTRLHLIKPLGFDLTDKYIKRSGMDYWQYLDLTVYENWQDFLARNPEADLYFFTTKTTKSFWDCPYALNSFLVFGNEGHGLPEEFYQTYSEQLYTIPMTGEFHRSFNLANSVAIALFEGIRREQ
ncbi:MAG: tRNA (cytidine(34)-2'-O)-methyltransferase [Victivallaceae bacterium]|nr:tRNA (cytidine(34)-2'-O)-methyltransferase [Victivallaceae bacterium]